METPFLLKLGHFMNFTQNELFGFTWINSSGTSPFYLIENSE